MSIKKCAVTVGVLALAFFVVPSFPHAASVRDIMREIERLQAELAKLEGDTNADSDNSDASIRLIAPDAGDSFQIDSSKKMKVRWQTARIPKNSEVCIFLVPSGSSVGYALPEDGDCTKAKNGSRSKSVRIDDQNFSAGEYYVRIELVSSTGIMLDEDASGVIDLEGEIDDEDEDSDSYEGDYVLRTSIDGRTVTATARVEFDVRDRCTQSMRLGRIEWGDGEDDNVGAEDSGTSCQDVITHRYDSDGRFTIEFFGRDGSTDKERITIGNDDGNASGSVDADVYDTPNPRIVGRAYDTDEVGISIGNGDKIYGSGDIRVNDSRWSHTVSEDLAPGTYRVTLYNGDNNELAHNDIVIMESSTSRARYEGFVGGKLQESTSRVTLTNAMALCASLTARNAGQSIRCEWNGRTVSETTGTLAKANYRAYLNGNTTPSISTNNISEADALANCKLTAKNNPASSIRCTWGTKEIYKSSGSGAVSCTFAVTPSSVMLGNKFTLKWSTVDATKVHIDQGVGEVGTSGTTMAGIAGVGTYTYTLTATNAAKKSVVCTAKVTVTPLVGAKATIDVATLTSTVSTPTLTGTASAITGIYVSGAKLDGSAPFASETASVKDGKWSVKLPKLTDGSYNVVVIGPGYEAFARGVLTVKTSVTKATYKAYLRGNAIPSITTENITEADALANCKLTEKNNPTASIRCTWGTKEIYKHEVAASNVTADVEFVNAEETVSQEGTPYGTFRVAFQVTAIDGNIYIPSTGGMDGAVGVFYKFLGSSAFGKPSQVLESTASKQGAYFLVKEAESKRFTLTVGVQPTASGSFAVALTQLGYNTTAAAPSKKITLNPSEFKTDAVAITVATATKTDVYKLYISNVLTSTTANALEATSLADCKAKATANGGKSIKCLWGTKEIYSRVANLGTIEKVDTTTYPDRVTIYWSGKAQYQNVPVGMSVTVNGKQYITTVNSNVGLIYLPKGSAAKAGDPILVNSPSPISMKASGAVLSLMAGVGAVLAEIPYNLLAIFTFG